MAFTYSPTGFQVDSISQTVGIPVPGGPAGGGWSFGWGPQDDSDSLATMHHASKGIKLIRTPFMGWAIPRGRRATLRELPASKKPYVLPLNAASFGMTRSYEEPRRVLKPDSIRRECEASLRRWVLNASTSIHLFGPMDTGHRSRIPGPKWPSW